MLVKKLKKERALLISCLTLSMVLHLLYGIEGMKQVEAYEAEILSLRLEMRSLANTKERYEYWLFYPRADYVAEDPEPEKEYIGEFEITYYTAGPESTGKSPGHPAYGITRSGTTVEEGRTIAADWDVLPAGTKVYIEGIGERIVEDTGGLIKGECIDVYVEDVTVARQGGRHKAEVWVVEE